MNKIKLSEVVGKGYKDYWRSKCRYCVCKGSRGSKKSKTTALWIIYHMMKYPQANTLVVRRIFNTLRDSCFADLKWASYRLGVQDLWKFNVSPLEATYLPTGQKILFRGLDNPMSITSITVEKGVLCWAWFEEAYQINNEDDFNKVDMSIRGQLPEGYFKRLMITFNPWNENHWLKSRFFDESNDNVLAMTTNYMCNEWLGEDDIKLFDNMRINNPRRYSIEGLGEWGISEGLIYDNWSVEDFCEEDIANNPNVISTYGLDWGYTNDPTAFISLLVDKDNSVIYVCDEHYEKGMTNEKIAEVLKYKGYAKCHIIADSAEPKSIDRLRTLGIRNIKSAKKGKDSIINGISNIQNYKIIVHSKCTNMIVELSNYAWDTKDGKSINKPIDDFNHLMDAFRYAMEVTVRRKNKATIHNVRL